MRIPVHPSFHTGMFNFGAFQDTSWTISELPIYMLVRCRLLDSAVTLHKIDIALLQLGAYGGIQGAVFVFINRRLSLWRFARVPVSSPAKRFLEALVRLYYPVHARSAFRY